MNISYPDPEDMENILNKHFGRCKKVTICMALTEIHNYMLKLQKDTIKSLKKEAKNEMIDILIAALQEVRMSK